MYLDQLLSAVELGHEDVLPVRDSGEGHVELPGGPDVGVFREAPQQRVLHQPHQVESRVQGPQSVPPALFGHVYVLHDVCYESSSPRGTPTVSTAAINAPADAP
ncbi:hypothetical protein EYF80_064105 [Liparis tanakae]|uniref:Uncharacterized protein n=1 Tax=Liparis tanakae TaxID=230148 RepID=A0A4Z2EAM2_9TELE|nr:hypothetical protein EYF80_064105 [Liparis tanakae]